MKNKDERILKYLDGQMDPSQRKMFEDELKSSDELRNIFDDYINLIQSVEDAKKKNINSDYAETILPEFRKRVDQKKYSRRYTPLAYGLAIAAIIIFILFITLPINKEEIPSFADISSEDINTKELDKLFDEMATLELISTYDDIKSADLDSIYLSYYSSEITESENKLENLFALNDLEYYEIEQILSEKELEIVFNEIINTEFY
ncbi:MAG: hypothetical protein R6W68_02600 [Ignavibacteriaceae bacterium]